MGADTMGTQPEGSVGSVVEVFTTEQAEAIRNEIMHEVATCCAAEDSRIGWLVDRLVVSHNRLTAALARANKALEWEYGDDAGVDPASDID